MDFNLDCLESYHGDHRSFQSVGHKLVVRRAASAFSFPRETGEPQAWDKPCESLTDLAMDGSS